MTDQQPATSSENPYATPAAVAELVAPLTFPPPPPTKPRIWTVFVALIVMVVAFFVANIIGGIGLVVWYFA